VFTLLYVYGNRQTGFYEIDSKSTYLLPRVYAACAAKHSIEYAGPHTMYLGIFDMNRKPNTSELGERLDQMIASAIEREPYLKDAVDMYLHPYKHC